MKVDRMVILQLSHYKSTTPPPPLCPILSLSPTLAALLVLVDEVVEILDHSEHIDQHKVDSGGDLWGMGLSWQPIVHVILYWILVNGISDVMSHTQLR